MQLNTNLQQEVRWLKRYVLASSLLFTLILFSAYRHVQTQRFEVVEAERINIVEKDGTVKMILTNKDRFPTGDERINNRPTNKTRTKRPGMLFFNDEGLEAGGFIFDGKKNADGHAGGMSLTFDRYDGDQVMQMLITDQLVKGKRYTQHGLAFNDYPNDTLTQQGFSYHMDQLMAEKDPAKRDAMEARMRQQGMFSVPRIYLGRTGDANNGLYLFDEAGMPRAMLYVDKQNKAKLEFFDDKGNVVDSWPKQK